MKTHTVTMPYWVLLALLRTLERDYKTTLAEMWGSLRHEPALEQRLDSIQIQHKILLGVQMGFTIDFSGNRTALAKKTLTRLSHAKENQIRLRLSIRKQRKAQKSLSYISARASKKHVRSSR